MAKTRVAMFLEQAPRMVSFFTRETGVAFVDGNAILDFNWQLGPLQLYAGPLVAEECLQKDMTWF
jgi:hypothetical protein